MASLLKMLLETMPGEGALTKAGLDAISVEGVTVGGLATYMEYVEDLAVSSIRVSSPPLKPEDAKCSDEVAQRLPIWSYFGGPALHEVNTITCRVRDEEYREYVVLDKLAFGSSPYGNPSQFDPCVRAVAEFGETTRNLELPLTEEFRVATFKTHQGYFGGGSPRWRVPGFEDVGFLHVFVFDYNMFCDSISPVSARELGDPALDELAKFRGAAQRLVPGREDGFDPLSSLFQDNLFEPLTPAEGLSVLLSGTSGELLEYAVAAASMRIVVICSLSLWKEGTNYSPGGAGGSARIFPHIMTKSTFPLSAVLATVQMQRPSATKIVGGGTCSCHEMLEEIKPLLVTDADSANVQDIMPPLSPAPALFWNNLFNYYYAVDSPSDVFYQTPIRAVCAERLARDTADNPDAAPLIERKRWRNQTRVTRQVYQGEFDNIHLAPRMSLKDAAFVEVDGTQWPLDDADRAAYGLDAIPMAPFCVHDCFHMHWRWADYAGYEQYGYTPRWAMSDNHYRPCATPGATMIPPNQDLWLWLLNPSGFNYAGAAFFPAADEWQVFCHHGAGYAVHTGSPMKLARNLDLQDFVIRSQGVFSDLPDGHAADGDGSNAKFYDADKNLIKPTVSWAAFYWHIHRYFPSSNSMANPAERVVIRDLAALRAF
jgi:hypothetical protein